MPVSDLESFHYEFVWPPALVSNCLRAAGENVCGCRDWNETLRRVATQTSEVGNKQGTNIPRTIFGRVAGHSQRYPGMGVIYRALRRRIARTLYPSVLLVELSGPLAWSFLSGSYSGILTGSLLRYFMEFPQLLPLLLVVMVTGWFILAKGLCQKSCHWAARMSLRTETPTKATRRANRAPDDAGHVGGESMEVIKGRFETLTQYSGLVVGEKCIGLGIIAPWDPETEDMILEKLVTKYDFVT